MLQQVATCTPHHDKNEAVDFFHFQTTCVGSFTLPLLPRLRMQTRRRDASLYRHNQPLCHKSRHEVCFLSTPHIIHPPSVTGEDDTKTRAKKEKATGGGDAHTSGVVWELCVNLARDGLVDVVELIFVVLKLLGRHGAPATPRHHPCCVQSERCQSC